MTAQIITVFNVTNQTRFIFSGFQPTASELIYRSYNSYGNPHLPAEPSSSYGYSYGGHPVNGAAVNSHAQFRGHSMNGPPGPAHHQFNGHRAPEGVAYNNRGGGDYRNEGRDRQEPPYPGSGKNVL